MKDRMEIIAPERKKHGDAVIDLIAKVFSGFRDYFVFRDVWRNRMYHGNYDWETSRIGIIGGQVVTHWGVWGYDMRIGSSKLKTGGIGVVATHADFRKRGLISLTAWDSIKAMQDAGYDMTILFGIDDFYHRFGYVRAWNEVSYTAKIKDLDAKKTGIALHKFNLRQRDDLDKIYNRENARLTGTAVRPTYIKDKNLVPSQGYLWHDDSGKVSGFVVVSWFQDKYSCFEACGKVDEILDAISILGRRKGYQEVKFQSIHYCSPLAQYLRQINCRAEISYKKSGEALIRTLNLKSSLSKMSVELSRRLKKSNLAGWKGDLVIADPREKVCLSISDSQVRVTGTGSSKNTIRGGEEIVQLIIGTNEPPETMRNVDISTTGKAKELISVLFPNQYPMLGSWDRY